MKANQDIHTMRVCFACTRGRHQVCIDARNTLCDCTHAATGSTALRDLAYADGYYDGLRHGRQSKVRDLTIGEIVERGWIACPNCNARRSVGSEGEDRGVVAACDNCGNDDYWYLFAEKL